MLGHAYSSSELFDCEMTTVNAQTERVLVAIPLTNTMWLQSG